MLQQILQDMYVDPDVLDALNEEQKKILFLKMRQEQVRRWKEREERLEKEATLALRPKPKKVLSKNVSWLLGRDGDVHVSVIGELDELDSSRGPRSGFGEKKPSSPRSNMWVPSESLRSNSVNRMLTEPVRTGRENLPPGTRDGIELSFRENTEDLRSGPHLHPLQVLEKEQRPLSPVKDAEKVIDSGGIADPPKALGPSKGPQLRNVSKTSVTAKWDLLDSQERHLGPVVMRGKLCPQDSLDHRRVKGRDFRLGPASCRPDPDGEEGGPAVARGRVAALMKNFNVPSRSKPPVPSKPTHLQPLASPSLR